MKPEPDAPTAVAAVRANEQILGAMLVLHGMLHSVGFTLAFELFEPNRFDSDDLWPSAGTIPGQVTGIVWLLTGVAIVVVGVRLAARRAPRAVELAVPLGMSVILSLMSIPAALPFALFSGAVLVATALLSVRRRRAGHRTLDSVRSESRLRGSGS